jgi:hypothetical protein
MQTLLCYARGRSNDWEAICVDFDIAVEGNSFGEAQARLEEAVKAYVEAAAAEAPADREKLLSRRAPLWVSLLWTWRVLRSAWRSRSSDDASASFPVAYPA